MLNRLNNILAEFIIYQNPKYPIPTPDILVYILLSILSNIIKYALFHLGGKVRKIPDLKRPTVAIDIVRQWGGFFI